MRKKSKKVNLLSIIIPAYNQEKTIQKDLLRIINVMDRLRYDFEIILVVDGIHDKTFKVAQKIKSRKLQVIGYENNRGKGYAVRYGMARAKGEIVAFVDSGMDLHPNGLSMLLEHFEWYNADIIVGSKLHPASKVKYPFGRKLLSWGYRMIVRLLFGLQVRDTQVGMKFYKKTVLDDVLPRLLVKTYAFDIEILAVAYHLGYKRIFEAPIQLNFKGASSITSKGFWRVILFMIWDTMAVFYRLKIVRYYNRGNKRKWRYDPELRYRINI